MLARTRELTEKILAWYEAFEFHRVYHAVNEFAIVDLSSFYLDVLKDRMYTFAPTSHARRSAQTVLWKITEALVRLVAPILSFTADEVWEYLPPSMAAKSASTWRCFPSRKRYSRRIRGRFLTEWRHAALQFATKPCRTRGGTPRQANRQRPWKQILTILATRRRYALLRKRHEAGLKEFIDVSDVTVVDVA